MSSNRRFTRDYVLTIGVDGEKVTIKPPFEISFSVVESILNRSLNKMNISITGLTKETCQKLIKHEIDKEIYLPVEFLIGYKDSVIRVFKGSVRVGEMSRSGSSFVSSLECYDGHPDFNESYTSRTVASGELSLNSVLEDMPNTGKGVVTKDVRTTRPRVLVGASSALLSELAEDKEFYIKDEKIFVINDDEVTSSLVPVVNADTGLKSTPIQDHINTTFVTVINPDLKIGGLCEIISVTNPSVNGVYKIYESSPSGSYRGAWEQTVMCRPAPNYKVVR